VSDNDHLFTGALLAGGRSSRMGRDKAELLFRSRPLWQHQVATLRQAGAAEILISGRSDAAYASAGVRIVPDSIANAGPLAGLASILTEARYDYVVVLAIDLPRIPASFLRALVEMAFLKRCSVVPRNETSFDPLAAVYRRNALSRIVSLLDGAERSLQHFVQRLVVEGAGIAYPVRTSEHPYFANINTPADLAKLQSPDAADH
jgi:molybdopterin-guanine dinucleotide biosynthesis protein A